jgi:hypothetical protein
VSSLHAPLLAILVAAAKAGELADPTAPPSHVAAAAAPSLRLQGILHFGLRDTAVIDGKRVAAGDQVGQWRVIEIRPDAVRLRGEQRELELRLAPSVRREVTVRGGKP